MTIYETKRHEIRLAILHIKRAEASLKSARERLRRAMESAIEDGASYSEIADAFIDSGRPISRQRVEQLLKEGIGD